MNLSKIFPPRPDWVHKGSYGNVLVVAGSKLYSGSATLAAIAALRTGADMVTVVAPQRAADVAAFSLPDLITYPLKGDFLTSRHVNDVMDIVKVRKINSVIIGCGMGRHTSTMAAVRKIIQKLSIPMVLDADALFAVSQYPKVVVGKHFVMTPHLGELATLMKLDKISDDFDQRIKYAKEAGNKYKGVILLKGHIDVITDGTNTITNNSGTPFMTKGGFGDVLSGIVGALLARGAGMFEAAHIGAYISGKAGEHLKFLGESVAASDTFAYIHTVLNSKE